MNTSYMRLSYNNEISRYKQRPIYFLESSTNSSIVLEDKTSQSFVICDVILIRMEP